MAYRASEEGGRDIAGSPESGQFQIDDGQRANLWSVAIGTRHLQRAHERCVAHSILCSKMRLVEWGEGGSAPSFAEVAGIVFEIMPLEATADQSSNV